MTPSAAGPAPGTGTERPARLCSASSGSERLAFGTSFFPEPDLPSPNFSTPDIGRQREIYYRNIVASFQSVRRVYGTCVRCVLFTTAAPPDRFAGSLADIDIEVSLLDPTSLTYQTNPSVQSAFPGCLFKLDVVCRLAEQADSTRWVLMDSDVLLLRKLPGEWLDTDCVHYRIDYPRRKLVNGRRVAQLLENSRLSPPQYVGGEWLVLGSTTRAPLHAAVNRAWIELVRDPSPLTEEHVLTVALNQSPVETMNANDRFLRCWTTPSAYRYSSRHLERCAALHLPSEKDHLLEAVYAERDRILGLSDPEWCRFIDAHVRRHSPWMRSLGAIKRSWIWAKERTIG